MPPLPANTPSPPSDRSGLGRWGETVARKWLEAQGYHALDTHVTARESELDLVAVNGDRVAFVEVRVRRSHRGPSALESIDPRKQRHLAQGAQGWMQAFGEIPPDWHFHFDLILIEPSPGGHGWELTHLEDAFSTDDAWGAGETGRGR